AVLGMPKIEDDAFVEFDPKALDQFLGLIACQSVRSEVRSIERFKDLIEPSDRHNLDRPVERAMHDVDRLQRFVKCACRMARRMFEARGDLCKGLAARIIFGEW